jgi:predicted HTH domain antitoxin
MAPTMSIQVELPRDATGDADPATISAELRQLWAVEQVRLHRFGVGKGAEVAAMPRAAFMRFLGEHGVPVIDYPLEDFREELLALGSDRRP